MRDINDIAHQSTTVHASLHQGLTKSIEMARRRTIRGQCIDNKHVKYTTEFAQHNQVSQHTLLASSDPSQQSFKRIKHRLQNNQSSKHNITHNITHLVLRDKHSQTGFILLKQRSRFQILDILTSRLLRYWAPLTSASFSRWHCINIPSIIAKQSRIVPSQSNLRVVLNQVVVLHILRVT
jgi:hypothetical protein